MLLCSKREEPVRSKKNQKWVRVSQEGWIPLESYVSTERTSMYYSNIVELNCSFLFSLNCYMYSQFHKIVLAECPCMLILHHNSIWQYRNIRFCCKKSNGLNKKRRHNKNSIFIILLLDGYVWLYMKVRYSLWKKWLFDYWWVLYFLDSIV